MLTHAARAAAKQLNQPPLVAARGAREGLWLEQVAKRLRYMPQTRTPVGRFLFTKPLGLNPNLIELNELKTRVSFFLKLDNGKYCP